MALALLEHDVTFAGPALPEPFVKLKLEEKLLKLKLLPKDTGPEGKKLLEETWQPYCRRLREMGEHGGAQRVRNQVVEPLVKRLGWDELVPADDVVTREGLETGGYLLRKGDAHLRVFVVAIGTDLDAPSQRGQAYRYSPSRVAERVLLASKERLGLLTDGIDLRLVLPDPAGRDSHIAIAMRGPSWRSWREVPDSFRLLLALASPAGVAKIPEIVEEARLAQTGVTKKLREQAKTAILRFVQEVLEHPENRAALEGKDPDPLARKLWRESLILVYRVLFILKLESDPDPARAFRFTANRLWKDTYSPSLALADLVRDLLDRGEDTGHFLEQGLRTLFRMFAEGVRSNEMPIAALGGALFGEAGTPTLVRELKWGERAVANLLDCLLWTPGQGGTERERVHYGSLDVEDLGRVYEALLELEPGIADEPMCRLRRAKLEVVVPVAQGEPYRDAVAGGDDTEEDDEPDDEDEDEKPKKGRGQKTKVQWIEEIPAGRFYVRVGLGRKASGSYYTPHPFVRFLVEETLGPQIKERSPENDPRPAEILKLKVLDPAMGSGHFLVEACRYLGAALYEACRLCDERALDAERKADTAAGAEQAALLARAAELRQRVQDLPDPNDELLDYLPSRTPEGGESGVAQKKAAALSRRLVTVHCLYGVDKNELAVELAKVALWLESYAEGLPLTFLDHRLVCGDSLTGPMLSQLFDRPVSGEPVQDIFRQGLERKMAERIQEALGHVRELEASVGKDLADLEAKHAAKRKLDDALAPIRTLAEAWSGAAMLGEPVGDDAFAALAAATVDPAARVSAALEPHVARMTALGRDSVPYDLVFPEVFHADGAAKRSGGFDAVIGNPPWDALQPYAKEFFAAFDLRVLDAPTRKERAAVEKRVSSDPRVAELYRAYVAEFERCKAIITRTFPHVNKAADGAASGAALDLWQPFAERGVTALRTGGSVGFVLPSAFHANQSATGIRALYLDEARLRCCFSYENKKKLFEIHASFKFAAVVAQRDASGTRAFHAAFYRHALEWLFQRNGVLEYTREFVDLTGGSYLSFAELRTQADVDVASTAYRGAELFGTLTGHLPLRMGEEMHMSKASQFFSPAVGMVEEDSRVPHESARLLHRGYVPLHEGKTFHQFTDRWEDPPRYLVALSAVAGKRGWVRPAQYFRSAFRDIASSTNERTGIFAVLPPAVLVGNTGPCEREPWKRMNSAVLRLLAIANTYSFDWQIRQKGASHVNLFILNGCPVPKTSAAADRFLAHAALRLSCNHAGYAPLWREQLGEQWREPTHPHTWPVLAHEPDRWRVRADIDAVVGHTYGLTRAQYEHVLGSFSHKSFPDAPTLCLAAFDDLERDGLDTFVRARDPYADVPLVETLPQPVIDLFALAGVADAPAADDTPDADEATSEPPSVPATPVPAWMKRTPTDRALLIACRAADLHAQKGTGELTNVKLEKLLHLVEAHCGIDLERAPIREAAGPADFPRLKKLAHRATMTGVLDVVEGGPGRGAVWRQGRNARLQLDEFGSIFGDKAADIDRVLGLFVPPMGPDEAEIVATLYASWNDLVAAGATATDDAIVEEFYRWAPGKRQFPRERLVKALSWMRKEHLIPTGLAKRSVARAGEQFGLLGEVPAAAPKKKPRKGR